MKLKIMLSALAAVLLLAVEAHAEYEGDTAPPYSVVKVVQESKACWPAYSEGCITLIAGEEVFVHIGRQITLKPRRGLICLRPVRTKMTTAPCYFAPLTAIEADDKPVTVIRMDPEEKQRVADYVKAKPTPAPVPAPVTQPEEPLKAGELPPCNSAIVKQTLREVIRPYFIVEIENYVRTDNAANKRWCYTYFASPYLADGGYRMGGPWQEAVYTIEWTNKSEGRFWLQVVQQQMYRKYGDSRDHAAID
jgi:hypothetical protein